MVAQCTLQLMADETFHIQPLLRVDYTYRWYRQAKYAVYTQRGRLLALANVNLASLPKALNSYTMPDDVTSGIGGPHWWRYMVVPVVGLLLGGQSVLTDEQPLWRYAIRCTPTYVDQELSHHVYCTVDLQVALLTPNMESILRELELRDKVDKL